MRNTLQEAKEASECRLVRKMLHEVVGSSKTVRWWEAGRRSGGGKQEDGQVVGGRKVGQVTVSSTTVLRSKESHVANLITVMDTTVVMHQETCTPRIVGQSSQTTASKWLGPLMAWARAL